MLRYIFFDLDGTLGNTGDREEYVQLFTNLFIETVYEEVKLPKKIILQYVITSLDEIRKNPPLTRTVLDVFTEKMSHRLNITYSRFMNIINRFYETRFFELKRIYSPIPGNRDIVELLIKKRLNIGVATDPVTRKVAVIYRIKWAGLDPTYFSIISNGEEFHAAKPHVEFFKELLRKAGIGADEAIMVGDSYTQDIVGAKQLGMDAVLVGDSNSQEFVEGLEPDFIIDDISKLLKIIKTHYNVNI